MTVNHVTDADRNAAMEEYGSEVIMSAADKIIGEIGCSPLSALCLLFQCAGVGLKEIGGPSAVEYMLNHAKAVKSGKHTQQTVERQMKAFEGMAQHSDLICRDVEGSA